MQPVDSSGGITFKLFQSDSQLISISILSTTSLESQKRVVRILTKLSADYHVVDLIDRTVSPPKHIDLVDGNYEGNKCSKAINDAFKWRK